METTEKIVEAYVRYIKNWFTIPNIKCGGQKEIDLLAIDTTKSNRIQRYHIECSVSVSQSYSKLTAKPFSKEELKKRVKKAGQRMTIGHFKENKFLDHNVLSTLKLYGFKNNNYQKVVVAWDWNDDVPIHAHKAGIELWNFRELLIEIANHTKSLRTYFVDDTMRTLQLMAKSLMTENN